MEGKMNIDIVIPIYKSKSTLEALIRRLNSWIKQSALEVRVLFVEDGSEDGTFEYLMELKNQIQFDFEAVRLARNYGQHTATAVGLSLTTAAFVAIMDDDLQHDPADIDRLLDQLVEENADLVYGVYKEKKHGFTRNLSSVILKKITKSKSIDFSFVTSFKVMKGSVTYSFKNRLSPIVFVDVFLLQNARKVATLQVEHAPRIAGKSSYSSWKLIQLALRIILFHSAFPLKMIVRFGFMMSLIFFIFGCYFIYQKLFNDVQLGFTSLIVSIFFSTGMFLLSLGIIGEYIRKIWISQQNLNQVVVSERNSG